MPNTASNKNVGKQGENLAKTYLEEHGCIILACNYRVGKYEVDIIARRNDILHFIEVKTRSQSAFGFPEMAVDHKKIERMKVVAEAYQFENSTILSYQYIQFDIIAIELHHTQQSTITWIEDIYN